MNILICTIVRDRVNKLDQWLDQLMDVVEYNKDHSFDISLYENDSVDGTKKWIKHYFDNDSNNFFNKIWVKTENLGTRKFGSIAHEERVKLLADARNKCMDRVNIEDYDYVLWIESDVRYNPKDIKILLDECENWDILSGASYEGNRIYDTWATRLTDNEEWWSAAGKEDQLVDSKGIIHVSSTFNCVCLYKAEAIKKHTFSGYSEKIQRFDCDTAVICEKFKANGYNKIGMNMRVKVIV